MLKELKTELEINQKKNDRIPGKKNTLKIPSIFCVRGSHKLVI